MNSSQDLAKRKNPRLDGYNYSLCGLYFLTVCTKERKCILSRIVGTGVPDCPSIELTDVGKCVDKYIKQLSDFYEHLSVINHVIMPNHIHIMLYIKENGQSRTPVPTGANSHVSHFISTLKRYCNKELGENIWQSRFHDHIIRSRADYDEHIQYIYENPKNWYYDELYSK